MPGVDSSQSSSSSSSSPSSSKPDGSIMNRRRSSSSSFFAPAIPHHPKDTSFVGTTSITASSEDLGQRPHKGSTAAAALADTSAVPNDLHLHRDPVYMWSSLVAAAGSSALASIVCAPLDLVRTRLQVLGDVVMVPGTTAGTTGAAAAATNVMVNKRGQLANIPRLFREIVRTEGVGGCFRGLGATLVTVPTFWSIYFPLYDDLKRHWTIHYPSTGSSWIHMGSAVFAGAVSDLICNPMFVVRTRLQTDALHAMAGASGGGTLLRPKTVTETILTVYQEGGILSFWRGMTANLIGLTHVGIQFPVYEALKKKWRLDKRNNAPTEFLAASALSKMMACLVSYPHEVIRSRMQDARVDPVGLWETCQRLYVKEGIWGFYSGLPVTLLRVIPNTCLTFLTYELLLQWARKQIEEDRNRR